MGDLIEGTVVLATGGFFDVDTGEAVVRTRMRGRLKRHKRKTDLCVIGDRVRISLKGDEEGGDFAGVLEEVLPRRSVFSRRHPGPGGRWREDVLVANLDQLLIVFAFHDPPMHARMLDRFLVIAEHNGIEPVIVANKVDQVVAEQRAMLEEYRGLGYPLHCVSATTGEGIPALAARFEGRISALTGPSGAGKSSILNAVDPSLRLRVGATSDRHRKGRHTTRVASLHRVAGGYVADTPGIRELGAWNLPDEALDRCFVEMRPFLGRCSFRDCRHLHEPGCAVKAAVAEGAISAARYESYSRMLLDEER